MSGLGELDRPGTPAGTRARDPRSQALPHAPGPAGTPAPDGAPARDGAPGAAPVPGPRSGGVPDVEAAGPDHRSTDRRRGGADPVKALMHRHRELCARAVDPLEIAAGLEAHGVTDRTAAGFRHRDVFSLAEEMYARVPRGEDTPAGTVTAPETGRPRPDWMLLALLPGAAGAAAVAGMHLAEGRARLYVAAAGLLALVLGVRAALGRGPLSPGGRARSSPRPTGTRSRVWWLLGYAALGDALLRAAVHGGPDGLPDGTPGGPWPLTAVPVLALLLSCLPAALAAHVLAEGARRRMAASRMLTDFAAAVRPLLASAIALYLGLLTALLAVCAAVLDEPADYARSLALGALLLLARLLHIHGFTHAPAVILTAVAAAEAAATATVLAARLPGCGFLAVPVETLVAAWGPGGVPALACGTGALILLTHAARTLSRASAHVRPSDPR
ncbi:hypothetical protein [Streptomyces sp. MUM 2J]|uniref:hypothetical protein n=1 Tax=Streptomyces sp. MUM 2J TaxID=2791987 RepID=UPI001F036493|nr:hypothetical protein [Streptomyces sp. MUM 2J]MCH0564077.1 hypothetical protein [Streptomyces sp. MUM 2J]